MFVIVVAGEVHLQPQLLVFGKIKRAVFFVMEPTDNCDVPQVFEMQQNSGAWLHCSVNSGAMLHCSTVHVLT